MTRQTAHFRRSPLDERENPSLQPRVETASDLLSDCGGYAETIQWTVVHTHPSRELWAAANLDRAGYETYLPLYTQTAGRFHRVVYRPLFPRYLFLGLEPGQGWVAAWHAQGVHKLCTVSGRPSIAPTHAVEALQAGEDARRSLPPPGALWASGAPCRLANGSPLDGIDAVVMSVSGDSARVHVLMFGELREVTVAARCLVARVSD